MIAGTIGPVTMALFGVPRNREDDPERGQGRPVDQGRTGEAL